MYNTIILLSFLPSSSGLCTQHKFNDPLRQADDSSMIQMWLFDCLGKKQREPTPEVIAEDIPQVEVVAEEFEPVEIRVGFTNGDKDIDFVFNKSDTVEMVKDKLKEEYMHNEGRIFFTDHPLELSYGNNALSDDTTTLEFLGVEDHAKFVCTIREDQERLAAEEFARQEQARMAEAIKNRTFNGHGKYTYIDGSVYEGNFVDGDRHGYGKWAYRDGSVYEGEFQHGERHGQGVMKEFLGDTYDGQWEENYEHGHGTKYYRNGNKYEGQWLDSREHGQGTMTYGVSGSKYVGQWKNGKHNGQGTMIYHGGIDKYEGEWRNNLYHGFGTRTYHDGSQHSGYFSHGDKHGHGTYTNPSGTVYEGEWEYNRPPIVLTPVQ